MWNCSDYAFGVLVAFLMTFFLPIVQLNVYITQICSQSAIKNNYYVPNSFLSQHCDQLMSNHGHQTNLTGDI